MPPGRALINADNVLYVTAAAGFGIGAFFEMFMIKTGFCMYLMYCDGFPLCHMLYC
jgi:hypothetical protein